MKPIARRILHGALLPIAVFGTWLWTPARHQTGQSLQVPSSVPSTSVLASKGTPAVLLRAKNWKEFQERFGKDLVAEFTPDGRLIKVEMPLASDVGVEVTKPPGIFNSADRAQATLRAKEIVAAAAGLLRQSPGFELQEPAYDGGPYSARVFFRESYQGRPVLPWGTIVVDLGRHGELRALYSTFVPAIEMTNEIRLNEDRAAAKANTAQAGRSVIWISELQLQGLAKAQGKYAYEFMNDGIQKVVDAEDGKILFERDRRMYR